MLENSFWEHLVWSAYIDSPRLPEPSSGTNIMPYFVHIYYIAAYVIAPEN